MNILTNALKSAEDASDSVVDRLAPPSLAALVEAGDAGEQGSMPQEASARFQTLAKPRSLRAAIKVRGTILFINLRDVVAVRAQGKYVLLQRNENSYLLRESISVLAERLESHGFIRIHRSVLVNTALVEEIRPLATGEYCLKVEGGREYTVTRTYKKNLKSLAEFWIGTGAFFLD